MNYDTGAIWSALTACGMTANFRLHYELRNERAVEDALIENAVARAHSSAEALARAAGMTLGNVKEMRYQRDGDEFAFECSGAGMPRAMVDDDASPDFDPEPIDIECHVDIDWWLIKPSTAN